jgi:fluoride exporter
VPHDRQFGPDRGPLDPDVDLHDEGQRRELLHHHPLVLGAIAAGGVIGSEARYGLDRAIPHQPGTWPWATLIINISGSLLIGALMAALARSARPPRVTRTFLGVGILGGFTTFSTYAVDLRELLAHHHPGAAAAYLLVTLVAGILAAAIGLTVTRSVLPQRFSIEVDA